MRVVRVKNTVNYQQVNYKDVTNSFGKAKEYKVQEQLFFQDEKGIKYKVDGKNVVLEPTRREKEVAEILGKVFGGEIRIIPRVNKPLNIKTPDYMINDEKFDLKVITGGGKYTIQGNLKGKEAQANNFIIDITNAKLDKQEVKRQIKSIYESKHYLWVDKIFIVKQNDIVKVYKRK